MLNIVIIGAFLIHERIDEWKSEAWKSEKDEAQKDKEIEAWKSEEFESWKGEVMLHKVQAPRGWKTNQNQHKSVIYL